MANRIALTAANIRYLLALKTLEKEGAGTRSVDIASSLGLSKPSVHNMMNTFTEMGLVSKNAYGAAFLTELGNETANRYVRYYDSVEGLLKGSFPGAGDVGSATCYLLAEKQVLRRSAAGRKRERQNRREFDRMLLATVVAVATAVLVIGAKAAVRYFIRKENGNGKDHA